VHLAGRTVATRRLLGEEDLEEASVVPALLASPGEDGRLLPLLWIGAIWWATFVLFGLVIAWADISIQKPPNPDLQLQVQAFGVIWIIGMIGWIVAIRRVGRRNKPH
jgi:hypothetical protein